MSTYKPLIAALLLAGILTSCSGAATRTENLSTYVELITRGDRQNAGEILKREDNARFMDLYTLLLPKLRSLDDQHYYYPRFIEKRQVRYPSIREYKRAGLIGEGLDGRLKIVATNPAAKRAVMQGTLNDLITAENFDREQIMAVLTQHHSGLSRKKLIRAFVEVRRRMSLSGDMVEVLAPDGNPTWEAITRE